jgi:methylenetetrahydrofolate reductase (NADPH)
MMDSILPTLSLEFFPPKTAEAQTKLWQVISTLSQYNPDFISITYGAGGGDRDSTTDFICRASQKMGLSTVAHLTCVGDSAQELSKILDHYQSQGITTILALRGDEPKGSPLEKKGDFHSGEEFVAFIRRHYPQFKIGVAAYPEGHPEAVDKKSDLTYFKKKVAAGADFAITQFFFDNHDYYQFANNCKNNGIEIPIIPGIMPVTGYKQLKKLSHLCGSTLPKWLCNELDTRKDDPKAMLDYGVDLAIKQSHDLLAKGVPGLHFFTMNQTTALIRILDKIAPANTVRALS